MISKGFYFQTVLALLREGLFLRLVMVWVSGTTSFCMSRESSISCRRSKSMLPSVIRCLILQYVSEMNRYTDLPSKNTIAKLVRRSDMAVLNCITKVSSVPSMDPVRANYTLTVDRYVTYYFRLSFLQKIRLRALCELLIHDDSCTSRMIWVFILATPPLYEEPDYRILFETSLLVQVFTKVLNAANPLTMYRQIA